MPSMAESTDSLVVGIPTYFQEAQHSVANHRKNAVALHRIHAQCAAITEDTPKGTKLVGEKEFNNAFMMCLNRVLHIKKGVAQADRCLKFVATYASYAQAQFRSAARKAAGNKPDEPVRDEEDDEEEDTPATRFVAILLKHAIKGFPAKNKNVRLRCCQVVALLINGLESLDDDLYQVLLDALLMRIKDKESPVRVQAIVALAKLQSGDDDDDAQEPLDDDETMTAESSRNVRRQLVETLRTDPSAEARRAAVFNLPVTDATLPYILERLRDTDSVNRRCVYLGSLNTGLAQAGAADLSSEQLDAIVKTGLGEREETVKRACKKLISSWVDKDGGDPWKLVDRFDGLKHAESTMMALKSAFETRPALLDSIIFDDEYWNNLTPNHALLARSVVEYLKLQGHAGEARLEEIMPLVMALAFRMQAIWSALVEILSGETSDDDAEEVTIAQASILESLLHLAFNSDYGDEIGRRKMFTLIREMISHPSLPTSLIEPCMDVLLKISAGQRDFVRIVVEIVQELADEVDDDVDEDEDDEEAEVEDLIQGSNGGRRRKQSPDAEAEGGREERKAASDGRQLLVVRAMLERMASNLHENTAIHGLIPQLIAPAVKSKDPLVREQGLFCLGFCCLLDAKLALDTFPLFLDQIQKAEGDIKLRATQIVFDLMLVHGIPYLSSRQAQAVGGGPEAERLAYSQIVAFLLSLLEDEEEGVQAVAAEGMAKLMMSGMVENDEALRSLVLVYMSPDTVSNQELRQCLSYFLPVYCFSSSVNQRKLQRVFVPVLQVLTEVYHEIGGEQEMVTPAQVGAQLIDWTDPSKAVNLSSAQDRCLHLDVCLELLRMIFSVSADGDRDQLKVIVQLLGKLTLPDAEHTDAARAKTFFLLSAKLKEVAPFEDTSTRNAFAKFELGCAKKWPEHAEAAKAVASAAPSDGDGEEGEGATVDLASDPDLEKLRAVFEACNLTLAVDEDEVASPEDVEKKTSSRKSASTRSRATTPKATSAAAARTRTTTAAKPRARSSRAAATKKTSRSVSISSSRASSVAPSDIDDDDDDDDLASTIGDLTADEDDDEDELAL